MGSIPLKEWLLHIWWLGTAAEQLVKSSAGVQAIKQQSQLGKQEGLGKLYSNLAACHLQQEHYQKAIDACQTALQVREYLPG